MIIHVCEGRVPGILRYYFFKLSSLPLRILKILYFIIFLLTAALTDLISDGKTFIPIFNFLHKKLATSSLYLLHNTYKYVLFLFRKNQGRSMNF